MLVNFDNSPSRAIVETFPGIEPPNIQFPEFPWKIWKFVNPPKYIWDKKETRLAFLEDYATTHGIVFYMQIY